MNSALDSDADSIDPQLIYSTIRKSIEAVLTVGLKGESTSKGYVLSMINEMARNSAHAVTLMLDTIEIEDRCPLCGSDVTRKVEQT
jgi:hypothetical protein